MHIPEGILNLYICVLMFVVALVFFIRAWREAKRTMPRSFIPLIAVMSAVVLVVRWSNFQSQEAEAHGI